MVKKTLHLMEHTCKKIWAVWREIGHSVGNGRWLAWTGRKQGRRCHCQSRQLGGSRVKCERVAERTQRAGVLREGGAARAAAPLAPPERSGHHAAIKPHTWASVLADCAHRRRPQLTVRRLRQANAPSAHPHQSVSSIFFINKMSECVFGRGLKNCYFCRLLSSVFIQARSSGSGRRVGYATRMVGMRRTLPTRENGRRYKYLIPRLNRETRHFEGAVFFLLLFARQSGGCGSNKLLPPGHK